MVRTFTASVLVLAISSVASAAPITIDGSTADWGPTIADYNGSVFNFANNIGLIDSAVEDSDDLAGDGGFVGPNQGGQNYDAEALALALQGNTFYGLIVSGARNDNGASKFGPGDILIHTTGGTYVIEVGGGEGGGAPQGAITEGADGSTYDLNSNGFTNSHTGHAGPQLAGSLWKNSSLLIDPIPPQGPTQLDPSSPGVSLGLIDYIFTRDAFTTQHSVIEFAIDRSVFGIDKVLSIDFRPACGNDELTVVPEPATVAMLFPFVCMLIRRRRTN